MAHIHSQVATPITQVDNTALDDSRTVTSSEEQLAWLAVASRGNAPDKFRYLLLLRFALINVVAMGLLAAAWMQGLVELVIASDNTGLSVAIAAVFLVGLCLSTQKVWQTSMDLNRVRRFDPLARSRAADYVARLRGRQDGSRTLLAGSMRLNLSHRIAVVRHIANSLVVLGLIGTVVGFIIALSGVDPESASDIKAVSPMVSTLVDGMSTALYTTLVGAVLNVWLMTNYHVLATGTVKLITALIEFGEANERA